MSSNLVRPATRVSLRTDFAERVVRRVAEIERQRSIRRTLLASTAVLGISLATVITWKYPLIWSPRAAIALRSPAPSELAKATPGAWLPSFVPGPERPAVDPFLPEGYSVTNFVNSSSESGWHSYDPWWGSNS